MGSKPRKKVKSTTATETFTTKVVWWGEGVSKVIDLFLFKVIVRYREICLSYRREKVGEMETSRTDEQSLIILYTSVEGFLSILSRKYMSTLSPTLLTTVTNKYFGYSTQYFCFMCF